MPAARSGRRGSRNGRRDSHRAGGYERHQRGRSPHLPAVTGVIYRSEALGSSAVDQHGRRGGRRRGSKDPARLSGSLPLHAYRDRALPARERHARRDATRASASHCWPATPAERRL